MKTKILLSIFTLALLFTNCSSDDTTTPNEEEIYFPPINSNTWETKSLENLGWNSNAVPALLDYLEQKHSKSFMILINGRIVMEEYFNGHTATSTWQWNSAGKTLVGTTTGIAEQEGFLSINNKVSNYIGTGWTSETIEKENLITNKHLLTMTSGLSDTNNLVTTANLTYVADAGSRWSYHNVFQKLMDVVEDASGQTFETYFENKLKNKIGMDGFWNNGVIFRIYHSNTRSMARFGLLALNNGKWENEQIINTTFFNASTTTSQNINPSYGYFWWLNGKSSFMVPGEQTVFPGKLVPNAPDEMYAAMGAEDQRIYVIPSKKMVIIRMGDASDPLNPSFAVSGFDNALWEKINAVIN
ncbi:Serine hydrolase [Flavobacterium sp. 9AF]|uniref:serine hydrolase domain-containing protein n=1 Tax=Flavobacterium sp. 9AF TaxID=2653142 RepID=UPI0012F4483F|nr:serine hydrolase [Flavobacterium sp. 9AF]VXB96416.1 Serine hydrolase [Flavobacterium sp. 9AF]